MIKFIRYVILPLIMLSMIFSFLPKTTYACSCVMPGPVQEEYNNSSAVFSGEVVKIVDRTKKMSITSSTDPVGVTLAVEKWYKGDSNKKQVTVHTAFSSASCGYEFTLNEKYLVYANVDNKGKLIVTLCSRTALLSSANEDIVKLDQMVEPAKQLQVHDNEKIDKEQVLDKELKNDKSGYTVVLITVLGILVVGLLLIKWMKRK